jgi:alpha-L-fucosidase
MKNPVEPVFLSALLTLFLVTNLFVVLPACRQEPSPVVPSPEQLAYQEMEMVGFIHFGMNTFTDREWGYGDEDPAWFNPSELDPEQWVRVAKQAGMKELILTAKHHDGFCLWPSDFTEHSIKNSPYKDGRGDVVRKFTDACRKQGLKAGLYLSPWDRNHADYGRPEYLTYYRNQLRELLTEYGEINEIWFDGANGGDGYYGGAREERRVDKRNYYDWPATMALAKELQPGIKIFSDAGPDIRWVGNEKGFAGETFWSTIFTEDLVIGDSDPACLNTGDPGGDQWILGQCDVSIRPGWFYHASEDSLVKSPQELVDIYYKSVGRNAVLLLNLPPDRRGLIHETDAAHLREFREIIDETFARNVADGAAVSIEDQDTVPLVMVLESEDPMDFDRILLMEDIREGQRIGSFHVDAETALHEWTTIAEGSTVGYKRILRPARSTVRKIRVVVTQATRPPLLATPGLYLASGREAAGGKP